MKTHTNGAERFDRCDRCLFASGEHCLKHAPRAIAISTPEGLPNPPPVTVITYWPSLPPERWCGDFHPAPQFVN